MNFNQFFRVLWARRIIVIAVTLACFVAAFAVAKILPARYEAKSRVMLDVVKPDPVTGEVIASQFARAYTRTQVELIRDYSVAGKVVDAFGWEQSPQLLAQYQSRPREDTMDFRRWLAQRVIDSTNVALLEGSNILEITYTSTSPENARRIADTLRQAYIDQTIAFRRETAARNAVWFREQAGEVRADLAAAENRKITFERENGVILQDDNRGTEESRLAALAMTTPTQQVSAAAMAASQPPPSAGQLAQVEAAIASASRTLGPNHPDILALNQQRGVLASAVARETAAARQAVAPAGGPIGPSVGQLYTQQQARVLAERGKVNEAQRLATDVAVLREQFAKTMGRSAELDQVAASNEAGMTVLGNAVAPSSPTFPNMPLIVFGSLGFGFALGVLMALLVELLSRRVRGVEDLEITGVPVIGVMSREQPAGGFMQTVRGLINGVRMKQVRT